MSVDPKTFDESYFYNICLGSDEFKQTGGLALHPRVKKLLGSLALTPQMDVLDIGCGRGDMALSIANKVRSSVGIDYSPDGIRIAKMIQKNYPSSVQKKTKFFVMRATKLDFKDNSFDLVLLIDTLDHLELKEQDQTLREISRVLRPGGELFIRTCANSIQLNYTYKFHTYLVNRLLTWIDQKVKKVDYEPLPKEPRTKEQAYQHISESNYFKLKRTLKRFNFDGKIKSETGFIKEGTGARTKLYNFAVALHPLSEHFPLSIFYGFSFNTKAKFLGEEKYLRKPTP